MLLKYLLFDNNNNTFSLRKNESDLLAQRLKNLHGASQTSPASRPPLSRCWLTFRHCVFFLLKLCTLFPGPQSTPISVFSQPLRHSILTQIFSDRLQQDCPSPLLHCLDFIISLHIKGT